MAVYDMLTLVTELDIQPGEVPPTIHLKQGSDSMTLLLKIAAGENVVMETAGKAIVKGEKPDGSSLFLVVAPSSITTDYINVTLAYTHMPSITDVAGVYKCTVSIIDSTNVISEADYEDYELITVQPFFFDIQASAVTA